MDELRKAITKGKWRKTNYVCYHEYIVQEKQPEIFRLIAEAIENAEFFDVWKEVRYNNLYVDGWKYWRMGNIINRKPAEPPSI